MNPWKRIHNEFKRLADEEDRIVRQRELQEFCNAYVTFPESGEVDCWIQSMATEDLQAGFEVVAAEAGIALEARRQACHPNNIGLIASSLICVRTTVITYVSTATQQGRLSACSKHLAHTVCGWICSLSSDPWCSASAMLKS